MLIIPVNYLISIATIVDPEGGELLNKLFEEHYKHLYCIAYDVLKNCADAEDAVSLAFMNIWTNIDSCTGKSDEQIIKFISVIARNAAIDVYRKRYTKKFNTVPLEYEDENGEEREYVVEDDVNLDEILLRNEEIDMVARCIDMLPEIDRQIIILKYDIELQSKDVAKILNMTVTAVDNRVSRMKRKLKIMLGEYVNG